MWQWRFKQTIGIVYWGLLGFCDEDFNLLSSSAVFHNSILIIAVIIL
jgi:hypothetical protein